MLTAFLFMLESTDFLTAAVLLIILKTIPR